MKNKSSKRLVETALTYRDTGEKILIFLHGVENVKTVSDQIADALKKGKKDTTTRVATLTGTLRGLERDVLTGARNDEGNESLQELAEVFARFLPSRNGETKDETRNAETVYLVCTSAGEVGVNISADHLICDLTTFESMAQRFGRVNRFGEGDANIDVFHEAEIDSEKPLRRKPPTHEGSFATIAEARRWPLRCQPAGFG